MTLKEKCKEHGYTLREFAEEIKISNEYLSRLNTGNKKNPSLRVLNKIAKKLGISVNELIEILQKE